MVSKKCLEAVNSLRTDTDYATARIDLELALEDFDDDSISKVIAKHHPKDRAELLYYCEQSNPDPEVGAHLYGWESRAEMIRQVKAQIERLSN